jgi:stage III sporulation protein AA
MNLRALPPEVQEAFSRLPPKRKNQVTELRFRRGQPVKLLDPWGEELLTLEGREIPVTEGLLQALLDRATGFSPYALKLEETGLYLPLENGCRMGLCGEAVVREGKLWGLRQVSSIAIRLAREHPGIAQEAAKKLTEGGYPQSALIVSPPGGGTTTFLRDLVRCLSERGFRVSVADERRELGAVREGEATLDLGPNTDILSGCPKGEAIPLLVRVMNPQVIALDEIAGESELEAVRYCAYSGVAVLATAHGDGISSLMARPLYRQLLESGAFSWGITLRDHYAVEIERLEVHAKISRSAAGDSCIHDERLGSPAEP